LLMLRSWGFRLFVAIALFGGVMSYYSGDYRIVSIFLPAVVLLYAIQVSVAVMSTKNRNAYLPATYDFAESGVTIKKQVSRNTLKWDALAKWKRVGRYYLVYASRHNFFVIPKSRIPGGRTDAFEALLSRKIGKK